MSVAVNSHALPVYMKISSLLCIFETSLPESWMIVSITILHLMTAHALINTHFLLNCEGYISFLSPPARVATIFPIWIHCVDKKQ